MVEDDEKWRRQEDGVGDDEDVVGNDERVWLEMVRGCGWRRRKDVVEDDEGMWLETTRGCGWKR